MTPAQVCPASRHARARKARESRALNPGSTKRIASAIALAAVVLGWSPMVEAQCLGNLLSNSSFETHTGSTNSIGDPIPSVWVRESGETGATTGFNPPNGSYVGYVWGIAAGNPGVMSQQVSAVPGVTYSLNFFSGTHDPSVNPT